jgi:hypothetical protein
MPLLVRKKLVSADCACAGALAVTDMAATARQAGKMARVKLFIEILPVAFYGSLSSTHRGRHYSGAGFAKSMSRGVLRHGPLPGGKHKSRKQPHAK